MVPMPIAHFSQLFDARFCLFNVVFAHWYATRMFRLCNVMRPTCTHALCTSHGHSPCVHSYVSTMHVLLLSMPPVAMLFQAPLVSW